MKKIVASFLVGAMLFTAIVSVSPQSVSAATSVSELIELLISIGVIGQDKAVAARAVAKTLGTSAGGTTSATSSATSTAYVQVLSPTAGESYEIDYDFKQKVTWGSRGLSSANVALVAGNNVCVLNSSPLSSTDGENDFSFYINEATCHNHLTGTSTALKEGNYKVRVSGPDSLGRVVKDDSGGGIKINPIPKPSLKVTYPNGREEISKRAKIEVKYNTDNVTDVLHDKVYVTVTDNNDDVVFTNDFLYREANTFDLRLPSNIAIGAYKIKVMATSIRKDVRTEISDISDNFFWLSNKAVEE